MKTFVYDWNSDIYLLHVQIDLSNATESNIKLTRIFVDGSERNEDKNISEQSHRFIISRTHPNEIRFRIEYGKTNKLTIYEIDDRAYYPTTVFFED